VDDVALANYVAGTFFGPVEAGRVDSACARLLGVTAATPIWFSDYTLMKLRERHGDINFQHYRHMPDILLHGFLARGRKANLMELWWVDPPANKPTAFFTVLKATKKGEVFVETFHQLHGREVRRTARKAKKEARLIRIQSGYEDQLEPRK
jgi:hypothetical protein